MTHVAIVDYGTGNVHSIGRMLTTLGVSWTVTRAERELRSATHLFMPGVGHAAEAMRSLRDSGAADVLSELVIEGGVPVLGICLGMQLMTLHSEEGDTRCLGWFDAATTRMTPLNTRTFKVPNIGWHLIRAQRASQLLVAVDVNAQPFYFCHAYAVKADGAVNAAATFDHESSYAAVIERKNIIGVQFHPEKSQEAGMCLMQNFLAMGRPNV